MLLPSHASFVNANITRAWVGLSEGGHKFVVRPRERSAKMRLAKSGHLTGRPLLHLEPFKKRTRYRRKRSSMDNGAALEEIFGQYLAAIRRNIDNVDPQGKETSHAGQ